MRTHLSLLAASILFASSALAFDVKGLTPGMKLDQFRKLLPEMQCKEWIAGPYEQMCDIKNLKGNLSTLADQPLVSIRIIADKNDIAHVIIFHVSCSNSTEHVLAAFQEKYGAPDQSNKLNGSYQWQNKSGDVMRVSKANGKDNVCSAVDITDKSAVDWSNSSSNPRPSKDL